MSTTIEIGEYDEIIVQVSTALPGVVLMSVGTETVALAPEHVQQLAKALLVASQEA